MNGFCEIHDHFLYGVDDGADSRERMEQMLDEAHRQGIVSLIATPHVTPGIEPMPAEMFSERLQEAQVYCDTHGYGMTLTLGAEILCTPMLKQYISRNPLPTLGNTHSVLIEFTPDESWQTIEETVALLRHRGYTPVLAHVERYRALNAARLAALRAEHQAQAQVNCATVIGRSGLLRKLHAMKLIRSGSVDYLSSDAHNLSSRCFLMQEAYAAVCAKADSSIADRLTRHGVCNQ